MTELPRLTEAARAKLADLASRQLAAAEWRARIAIPLRPDEIEHTLSLVRWFVRRYPTAADRLAYVRRAYARWQRAASPPSQSGQ